MSIFNKEEVCTHRLVLQLGEPAVGMPIKKRPVSLSESSPASSMPPMKSLSSALEVPVSAEESFNTAKRDANVVTKGKGIINSQISDHADRSFTLPMANDKGVLLDGSNEIPTCAEINGSTARLIESKNQNFSALDLQLASCRQSKNNYGSAVKKEKVDQCLSSFHSAQPNKNVQVATEIDASSNISFLKLPNLDLNVPPDTVDSNEGLPAMHESRNGQFHGSIDYQNAQLPTIGIGPGRNIDSLNMPNTYRLSQKCGPDDVTLDLQLKPPARPEIGKNWKGLAPAPELSLSLSGTSIDEPMALSAPNPLLDSEPALSLKIIGMEAATLGSDKSTVEEAVAPVPCKANSQNTSPTVTGTDKMVSHSMVKKEPEEPSLKHIIDDVEKKRMSEQQSTQRVSSCVGYEKTDSATRVPGKTQLDLNSDICPNSSIHNGHGTSTDNVPIPSPSLTDIVPTEVPAVPDKIQKSVKREESTGDVPSPAVATVSAHAAPILMAANSLPSGVNVANSAIGSCVSIQRLTSPLEPSFSTSVRKPPASSLSAHEDMTCRPSNALQLQLQSSSNPIAEPSFHSSRGYTANDGMSQGSAEMDCSDDDGDDTVFRLRNADNPQGGPSRNGLTTEDGTNVGKMCKELKRELDSDSHQDCSSVTNMVTMGNANDEQQREVSIDKESKENQLLKIDKICALSNTDNNLQAVKTFTGSCSTDLQRPLASQNPASKIGSIKQSQTALDTCPKKTRSLDIKSETSLSTHGKVAASSSEDCAKNPAAKTGHGTEIEEAASENSNEKSKPDSNMTPPVSNEIDGQLVGSHLRDLRHAYVNRNERWERFMESEREKSRGGYQDGRHGPDMINQRRADHHYGGRGTGPHSYVRNFRGPRMGNEFPFEDDLGHLHRFPHRRRHSPPGRDVSDPRLLAHGQTEDIPDDMIQERFFRPHSHRRNVQGDHGFIHRERSHSPGQRRVAPVHFHRGRSPEAMHRSPPLPHRCPTRRNGSPLDRIGHDERGMQRITRRFGMREGDAFEPPLHPAHVAGRHAEEELMDRRKYRDRRAHLRSLEEDLAIDDEMLSYHLEEELEFAECGGPQELDGRLRTRMGHRMRGEQEDSCRHRGPQGWRDVDSNDNRPKRRRY